MPHIVADVACQISGEHTHTHKTKKTSRAKRVCVCVCVFRMLRIDKKTRFAFSTHCRHCVLLTHTTALPCKHVLAA